MPNELQKFLATPKVQPVWEFLKPVFLSIQSQHCFACAQEVRVNLSINQQHSADNLPEFPALWGDASPEFPQQPQQFLPKEFQNSLKKLILHFILQWISMDFNLITLI